MTGNIKENFAGNIIGVKNLSYKYPDGTLALNDLNIDIPKGSITAILGGNGAGKSTLLLTLNGILKPTSGAVLFKDVAVEYSRKGLREIRQKVGLVFQDPDNQLFSASVYQDISFGLVNMGLAEDVIRLKVEKVMDETGIAYLKDKPTHALSFGQKKRVAIAGVLAMQAEVIVFDEPTAGLDPMGVSEILKLLCRMKDELGITVIISTHDIDVVPLYCEYAYVIENGKNKLQGTPDEIFKESDILRKANLRLPRIAHLMEILKNKDGMDIGDIPSTISGARREIRKLGESESTK